MGPTDHEIVHVVAEVVAGRRVCQSCTEPGDSDCWSERNDDRNNDLRRKKTDQERATTSNTLEASCETNAHDDACEERNDQQPSRAGPIAGRGCTIGDTLSALLEGSVGRRHQVLPIDTTNVPNTEVAEAKEPEEADEFTDDDHDRGRDCDLHQHAGNQVGLAEPMTPKGNSGEMGGYEQRAQREEADNESGRRQAGGTGRL